MVVVVMMGACASGGGSSSSGGSRNVLNENDLAGTPELNCHQVVQRLRPNWLRLRSQGMGGTVGIQIYVDGVHKGPVRELLTIRAQHVRTLRFLSASEATVRFGFAHGDGAILVTLK